MRFPERPLTPPDDPMERARDEWESKFSLSEALDREDLDYLCQRVEAGDFKTLQSWLKEKQEQAFLAWKKAVDEEERDIRAEAADRMRDYELDRWACA